MNKIELKAVDVNIVFNDELRGCCTATIKASLNEAVALLSMPCFAGLIVSVVPCYELPEVSEE